VIHCKKILQERTKVAVAGKKRAHIEDSLPRKGKNSGWESSPRAGGRAKHVAPIDECDSTGRPLMRGKKGTLQV